MNLDLSQILFQIINFFIPVGGLTILLYKPILKIFDERAKRIEEGQKAAAEALKNQAQIEEYKKESKKLATKEKNEILKDAHNQAAAARDELLERAKADAIKQIEKMRTDWQAEKTQSLQQSQTVMIDAVMMATEKVLGEKLDSDKKQKDLIDAELQTILKTI